MNNNIIIERLQALGIIPVVVLDDAEAAEKLGGALRDGGLPCAEVTFRTAAAAETIRIMSRDDNLLVGAGTVLNIKQVDQAVDAGAKFIVSPGLNPKVVKYCVDNNILIIPGTQTPSEMEQALDLGLDVVKFFPAEAAGGLSMIKAVAAPYANLRFIPTGGINSKNARDYLAYDRILAVGGSWMVSRDLILAGSWDRIKGMIKEAAEIVREIRG